ncbi:putative vegetative incompatibility protein HET-E-1 [Rhizoctonia solani 123E]|uniref:Putative vegetative incompatibility protein HET-E-1 n=1 Tax=Rhizoctonia solani 123E TaxID=1423351 RepID=A0A074SL12_9AGAM|nr:putative vegetative incompatibility protein HET-E-1 [Rhizoctonia solani 123E]
MSTRESLRRRFANKFDKITSSRGHLTEEDEPKDTGTPVTTSFNSNENRPDDSDVTRSNLPEGAQTSQKRNGSTLLWALKATMRVLQGVTTDFLGVRSRELLAVLDTIEAADQVGLSLQDVALELPQWALILSNYISDGSTPRMSQSIHNLAQVLIKQLEYIQAQQQDGKLKRLVEFEQGFNELERVYRRIEVALRQLLVDASLSTWRDTDELLKDSRLKSMSPAHLARYNSSFSDEIERNKCYDGTRVAILEEISYWIDHPGEVKVYWMNGMAGTGKTTIAYTVCAQLEKNKCLGASFFCSRASSECREVSRILPTIAYQLAEQIYPFRSALSRILGQEPNIAQRNISVQFERLILLPLAEVKYMLPTGLVIVIDALDECSDPKTIKTMLETLLFHAPSLPIRFFLTSRPEPAIANSILAYDNQYRSIFHLHSVEEQSVKADIETYLTVALDKLSLSKSQIKRLVEQAGILFIYASTVVRYILPAHSGANSSYRLATIFAGGKAGNNQKDGQIDHLYKSILNEVLRNKMLDIAEIMLIQQVLWAVVCIREPVSVDTLAALLRADAKQVAEALQPLQSVLHILGDSKTVSTLHASFSDFMLSPPRSGPLCCDERALSEYLANRCFDLMDEDLRFNICDLETSCCFDCDVPMIQDRVKAAISPQLFYACRFWCDHLSKSTITNVLFSRMERLLYNNLLFWMEVLNLKEWTSNGLRILADAKSLLLNLNAPSFAHTFIGDAFEFMSKFSAYPVHQSTPHLYLSALSLVPVQSKVREIYWERFQGIRWVDGTIVDEPESSALATWEIEDNDHSNLSFSPDGEYIAYSSSYRIAIHNAYSGTLTNSITSETTGFIGFIAFSPKGKLIAVADEQRIGLWDYRYHGGVLEKEVPVVCTSFAFSPDGELIAAGGEDFKIGIYSVDTGALLRGPFQGHTEPISSIAFFPDGHRIVSGSHDRSVRVWNLKDGTLFCPPYRDHYGGVTSVAVSSDGTRFISAFSYRAIRMWSAIDGSRLLKHDKAFRGHEGSIDSVAFSPDGTRIVSVSRDRAVRVWSAEKGTLVAGPFEGHASAAISAVFSPDGARVASISLDGTIRMWGLNHGLLHNNKSRGRIHVGIGGISSVAFSSGGDYLASGSWKAKVMPLDHVLVDASENGRILYYDYIIHIWHARRLGGALLSGPFIGHTGDITSVAFSFDSTRVVSGSVDHTVRVWDTNKGILLASPLSGHRSTVTAVSFSLGGSRIVSGAQNGSIRVWDSYTGVCLISTREVHTGGIASVIFSENSALILSRSWDSTTRKWDSYTGALLDDSPFKGRVMGSRAVAISPDGTKAVSGTELGVIWAWDIRSGNLLTDPIKAHKGGITSLAFSFDGMLFVSGSDDQTIRVWELPGEQSNQGRRVGQWQFNSDGWMLDSASRPLRWLPLELRRLEPRQFNNLIIDSRGSLRLHLRDLLFGEYWQRCYIPETHRGTLF